MNFVHLLFIRSVIQKLLPHGVVNGVVMCANYFWKTGATLLLSTQKVLVNIKNSTDLFKMMWNFKPSNVKKSWHGLGDYLHINITLLITSPFVIFLILQLSLKKVDIHNKILWLKKKVVLKVGITIKYDVRYNIQAHAIFNQFSASFLQTTMLLLLSLSNYVNLKLLLSLETQIPSTISLLWFFEIKIVHIDCVRFVGMSRC